MYLTGLTLRWHQYGVSTISVKWADPTAVDSMSKDQQVALIEREVEGFSAYMSGISDPRAAGPLTKPERALVTTFLVAKLRGKI